MGARVLRRAAALILAAATGAATGAAAQELRLLEAPEDLPEGPGREDAFYLCSTCHGFNLVARQGMSRALWNDTLDVMVERHGMAPLDAEDRELILGYLEAAYPAPPARGWTNPFADQ